MLDRVPTSRQIHPKVGLKTVRLLHFGAIRERRGCREETLVTSAATLADLYDELNSKCDLGIPRDILSVAVNDEFRTFQETFEDGDRVVFMMPAAGG